MRSYMACTPKKYYSGDQIDNEMSGARSMYGGEVHTGFWWEDNIKVDL